MIPRPALVACDLDGTLTARDNKVSDRVADAVGRAVDAGIAVLAVSGRPWQWVIDIAREHRMLPYSVASNGAAVVEVATGVVQHDGLADGAVHALMERIRAAVPGITFAVDLAAGLAHEPGFLDPGYLGNEEPEDLGPLVARDVVKLIARKDGLPGPELVELLDHEVLGGVGMPHAGWGEWVEILASGVTKATGLAHVAALLGVAAADVLAIGDEWNDVPMFEWAGTAVAMGNAPASVQEAADHVAPTVDDDGVAVVLEGILSR